MSDQKFYNPLDDFFADAAMVGGDDVVDSLDYFLEQCDVEFEDVKLFQQKFGMLVHDKPVHLTERKLHERANFMQEELDEFTEAVNSHDLAKMADALIDLVYVAKGTAVSMGLPWRRLWNEVQRANMDKVRGIGPRGVKVDCIKPDGWQPPNIEEVLKEAGYSGPWLKEDYIDDAENSDNI